ncbi:hypothetical protein DXG01_015508 [Tephrocybe rancida]|nr:hypothetical protein DXG01_015508 [Tephrocybe rancida]
MYGRLSANLNKPPQRSIIIINMKFSVAFIAAALFSAQAAVAASVEKREGATAEDYATGATISKISTGGQPPKEDYCIPGCWPVGVACPPFFTFQAASAPSAAPNMSKESWSAPDH